MRKEQLVRELLNCRYAHRGLHDKPRIAENSMTAFERAAAGGFGIELDVHLTGDGRLNLILSPLELPYECPLIRDRLRLTPAFIRATYTVWTHLIRDPLIFDLVEFDSAQREEMGKELVFVPVPRRVDGRLDGRVCLKGT